MTRTCDFCGRKFSNRKALRGHIRVHNQAMKNNGSVAFRIIDRLKQRCNLRQDMNLGRDAVSVLSRPKSSQNWVQHICRICNRPFLSEKSLFRHMRYRPKSIYQGTEPLNSEKQSKNLYSSSEESDQDTDETESCHGDTEVLSLIGRDLLEDLPNWSKTDKRGQPSTSEAACNLMSLLCAASHVQSNELLSGCNSHVYKPESSPKKLKLKDSSNNKTKKGKHVELHVQPTSSGKEFCQNQAQPRKEFNQSCIKEEETSCTETWLHQNSRPVRFQCSTCRRIFPSFHALGGHRSSHNKRKGNTASASQNHQTWSNSPSQVLEASVSNGIAASAGQVHKEEARAKPSATEVAGRAHQCGICNRSFGTGQALGGA